MFREARRIHSLCFSGSRTPAARVSALACVPIVPARLPARGGFEGSLSRRGGKTQTDLGGVGMCRYVVVATGNLIQRIPAMAARTRTSLGNSSRCRL